MRLQRLAFVATVVGAVVLVVGMGAIAARSATAESGWALKGTWSDTCSCKLSCPCFFGSGPTEKVCEGSSLIEIDEGHYGGVDLGGMAAVVSYSGGKWTRIYVADTATEEQAEAFGSLVPLAVPFLSAGPVETVEVVPISVERTQQMVKYSSPESAVEIEIVMGANGKPVVLENMPVKGLPFPESSNHTQYRSVASTHHSEEHEFEWKGRSGFVASLDVAGDLPDSDS